MAIEILQDCPSPGMSPRISFSYDIASNDTVPIEQYIRSSSSSIDFDFCVFRESFNQESSSAEELFLNGKILPIEIKKRLSPPPPPPSKPPHPLAQEIPRKTQKIPESDQEKQVNTSKPSSSFWRFKRSASLNCGSGYARTLCPLPLLSRSNSTGSTASAVKRSSLSGNNNQNQKQHLLKNSYSNSSLKQQSVSSGRNHQKPPLKKQSNNAWSGNGVKISPALNVHSANMFGLGYLFSGSKDKNKK